MKASLFGFFWAQAGARSNGTKDLAVTLMKPRRAIADTATSLAKFECSEKAP
jgi:hypothetical protein